ncbi:dNA segregation ATPase FtsK/SpoIIIE family [Clostridium sp. CAG:780]|nr:dNA segregation ATPase FtsK/SpoIIIE family [Clostridium sp. CAG:780]
MAKRGRKKKKQDVTLVVVVLILASILMGVLIYSKSGVIGETLSPFLGGIMGYVEYILPIGIFIVAIYIACQKETAWMSKIVQFALMLLCIAIIMNVYAINKGQVTVDNKQMQDVMGQFYQLGAETGSGGGAAASIITIPLIKLLDKTGTVVLAIGGLVALTVSMFGIDLANKISEAVEGVKERKETEEKLLDVEDKKEKKETKKEKRLREKLEKEQAALDVEQLKINLNNEEPPKGKLFNIDKEEKLFKKNKKEEKQAPEFIEDPLFKTQEKAKEDETKQVLQLEHTITVEDENYEFPPLTLLKEGDKKAGKGNSRALTETASKLQKTLYNFGVVAKVEHVSVGPAITRYELKPSEGVRVSKIANLADDIALNLAAKTIRIEAPIPGKQAVGIEVPNEESEVVHLRDILDTDTFKNHKSKLAFALGKDVSGEEIVTDIAKMPHVMIAGATGSGKSVCINTLIASIIYKAKPSDVKLIMVDPKIVELSVYNGIPHLMIPVVTDPKKAAGALAWAVQEMENRYTKFAAKGVRDLAGYNDAVEKEDTLGKLPHIVIIIDELADLMMVAKNDVEGAICRLAQKARAAGMHLVIATQRPSVDVITGLIKANIPSRIAFAVSSQIDSRTILDQVGAEKLLGKGDMLFFPTGAPKPVRVQGAFVSDKEVEKIVDFLKSNGETTYRDDITEYIEKANCTDKEIDEGIMDDDETDPLLNEAIQTVIETGQASTSFIQRRFKVGYARAGRIIDQMEERGIISGYQGSKPREVLMTKERWEELNTQEQA